MASPTADVTLCCIDCINQPLALRAMRKSRSTLPFAKALFLTSGEHALPGIQIEQITPLSSRADYSRFVVKDLIHHIDTEYVLLIQWDGYIVNPAAWSDEFLEYDYIGAPWGFYQDDHRVGNGGFSLRSRKLLEALQDPEITDCDPEDEAICRRYRPLLEARYGIRFAPEAVAARFSFETTYPQGTPFGFHALYNMWMFIPPEEFDAFLAMLSPKILTSPQCLQLSRNYRDLGKTREAQAILRRRLQVAPDDAEAAALLRAIDPPRLADGNVRRNDPCPCGSGRRYKECCGQLGASTPPVTNRAPSVDDLVQAGMQQHQAGKLFQAGALYEQALRLEPNHAIALHYSGVLRMQQGKPDEAEPLLRRALEMRSDIPDFHNNLGLCLRALGRLEEALAAYRMALEKQPNYVPAWNNTGLDLHKLGRLAEALEAFNRALELDPNLIQARFSRALVLLTLGDYERGWAEYEMRIRCPEHASGYLMPTIVGTPRFWQGEPLAGKRILLQAEQGIGDSLQFIRYARLLAEQGENEQRAIVGLHVRKPHVAGLLRGALGLTTVYVGDEAIPEQDYLCRLLSLPSLCGTRSPADVPAVVPYLTAPADRRAYWRQRLDTVPARLRVGLSWAGSPTNADDRDRSCHLEKLVDLFTVPDVAWINLQLGAGREQLQTVSTPILDWGDEQTDYAETAALMAELDLIVTVDTSIAHAAGALGRPVWIMLQHMADFRWLLDRDDSPWYPTARLFRQPRAGDWQSVVSTLRASLADLTAMNKEHHESAE